MRRRVLALCILAAAPACHRDSYYRPISMNGVQFVAQAVRWGASSDTVDVWVTIRNTTEYAREIRQGGCPPSAQFVTARVRKNEVIHKWDWIAMQTALAKKQGALFGCPMPLYVGVIRGGYGTVYKAFRIAAKDVLGDSLQPGPYAVTLVLPVQGVPPIPAGVVDLPADGLRLGP